MTSELKSIISNLKNTLDGEPWFGRSVYSILNEIDPSVAFKKPGPGDHSLVELLYHMLTWAQFTLARLQKEKVDDLAAFEQLDWRIIDPEVHGWEEGLPAFIATHQEIIAFLERSDDKLLDQAVDYRNYNFRFLINGLIQHNIYHLGQVAYLHKHLN